MKSKTLLLLAAFCLLSVSVLAQDKTDNPYINKKSIGETPIPTVKTNDPFATLAVDQWLNERFIFMPRRKGLQEFGYSNFHLVQFNKKGKRKEPFSSDSLPYEKYVGRIAKVVMVGDKKSGLSIYDRPEIQFKLEDTGEVVSAEFSSETLEGVTPVAVLDAARGKYSGKTLWIVASDVHTYNATTGEAGYTSVRRYSPVRVQNVVVGDEQDAPIRFILETEDKKQGFLDVALSGTNVSQLFLSFHGLANSLLTEDPHLKYQWDTETWSLIEQSKVKIGMTTMQARMCLGIPYTVNIDKDNSGTTEQWIYGIDIRDKRYFYFKNGKLVSIQE